MKYGIMGTSAALATSLALSGCSGGAEKHPSPSEISAARKAIAAPYASCVVKDVVNEHRKLSKSSQENDGFPREVISVELQLTKTAAAEQYMEKYKDDDTIIWDAPTAVGQLSRAKTPYAYNVASSWPGTDIDKSPNFNLYPRTGYPDGTNIDVYAVTGVQSSDISRHPGDAQQTHKFCGTLVMNHGDWKVGSDIEPTAKPYWER